MKGQGRAKLSVTLDPQVYQTILRHADEKKVAKSRLVEEAVRLWEKNRLARLAKDGYQKLAGEDLRDAEAYWGVLEELTEE